MTPRKYNIFFAYFPYGGNGSAPSENPAIRNWWGKTLLALKTGRHADKIAAIMCEDFADTPITMTRNAAVLSARKHKADILVMVDSDMVPDMYLLPQHAKDDPAAAVGAKPFIDVALAEIDDHYEIGPIVIGAPYCGPPPSAPVYIFHWEEHCKEAMDPKHELRMFSRNEAAIMTGVGPAAALPTGMIAYDMRAFNLIEPIPSRNGQDATRGSMGFFYYEFDDHFHANKGSTEDVTNTRDICFNGVRKLGYNPLRVAWDCWAGHVKPLVVGKPRIIPIESVEGRYAKAVRDDISGHEKIDAASYIPPETDEQRMAREARIADGFKSQVAEMRAEVNGIATAIPSDTEMDLAHRIRLELECAPAGSIQRVELLKLLAAKINNR